MLTLVESWHVGTGGVTWVRNLEASEYFRSVQMYFESLDVVGLHISSGGMRGDQGSNPGGVRFFSLCTLECTLEVWPLSEYIEFWNMN